VITLRSLGRAEIETDGKTVTPSQQIMFAAGLYLVLERGKRVSRTRLSSLLWPEAADKARAHRLRQTLVQLRKLGIAVCADRNSLHLAQDDARTDFDDLSNNSRSLCENADLLEFLPGYDPHFSDTFHDWLDRARERAHAELTRVLVSSLQVARDSGNWTSVDRISGQCLALDAYNESAVLARAEAYAMRGQKAAAVSMLDRYIEELAPRNPALVVPATILRKRVIQHAAQSSGTPFVMNEPDFVGRESEMAMLTQLLDNARHGCGGGCLIDGEPGIGKTRLSSELAKFAELQGVRVQRVGCKRADMNQPLSAFVGLVPCLRELPGALGCSQKSLRWLRRLTELDTSPEELPAPSEDSGSLYLNLRAAVFDLLDAVSEERCLFVIVDDVQWLDRASAKLFASIIEWLSGKQIFLLFNSREVHNPVMEVLSPQQVCSIHLEPLANREAVALLGTILNPRDTPSTTEEITWLVNTGDGNPFFLQELTKQWLETGRRHEVPPSIATVLEERISRLSSVARQLLQACAVLGENSNLERLEHVLEYPPHELLSGVQELSAWGMLRCVPTAEHSSQALVVRHDLLSSAVLNGLAAGSLAFLHRRCGSALEPELLGTSISTSLLRACAFHWHHSGDSERAYRLAVKCANHLLEIGLAMDAATAFEGALGFCSTIERKLEVLERIVQALRMARDWSALLEAIARIRALQTSGPVTRQHDDLEIMELDALRMTATGVASLLSRTLTCVYDSSLPAPHRIRVAGVALKLASSLPDLEELQRIYLAVGPLLSESIVDQRARLEVEVIFNAMCGDLREALRFARERVAFERAEGTPSLLITAMVDLASVLSRAGVEEEIAGVLREGYEIALQHKLFVASRNLAGKLVAFLVNTGRPGAAEWMQRADECHGESSEVQAAISRKAYFARIALAENRLGDARRILERELDWEWLRDRRGWLAASIALLIRVQIAQGARADEIEFNVEQLRQLYVVTATLGGQDYEVAALCAGLLYLKNGAAAETYLTDYLSHKRRDLSRYSKELTEVWRALHSTQLTAVLSTEPLSGVFSVHSSTPVLSDANSFEYSALRSKASQI
jgi:DNA-binding SARP family transcriptional activator